MPPLPWLAVGEHRAGRVMPRCPRDSAAWMSTRSAQIQTLERHPVVGRTDHRPGAEQLVEPHLAVEDVAADQAEAALEVERRMNLPPKHRRGEARRVRVHRRDDRVRGFLFLVVPAPPRPQVEAKMLAE